MPRPRTQQDGPLLQSAMQLFWRNGFHSTGIRELEAALGMKAPSIYNRFGSKEALFQASLAYYIDHIVGWRIRSYLQAENPLHGLREFFDTTYNYISAEKPPLACLLVNTSLEVGAEHPLFAEELKKAANLLKHAFKENLNRAKTNGSVASNANVEALAEYLHLSVQGLLVTSKVETDKAELSKKVDVIFSLLPLTSSIAKEF